MILTNVASFVSVILYSLTTILTIKSSAKDDTKTILKGQPKRFSFAWLACGFHLIALASLFPVNGGINLSFFSAGSLVIFIVVLILNITSLSKPVEKLGLIIFPMAALTLLMNVLFPLSSRIVSHLSFGMEIHILVSIAAYSLFNIAATQAILLALQDYQLRHREPNKFIRSLPPIQTMETLLFQMITAGLIFLSFSLLSGIIFVENLFDQHLAHKTVLSIIAWLVFSTLLWGRHKHGWRGQTAIRWTLIGFLTLVLAYFGSKMVIEVILDIPE